MKISPGCAGCYAETSTPARVFGVTWGAKEARHKTKPGKWLEVRRWNRQAPDSEFAGKKGYWPVFCSSLSDVFDRAAPQAWRDELWAEIEATPNLTWLIVTKRIGNARTMVPARWLTDGFPANVRIIATVVTQAEVDRVIPVLLLLPCRNGISYEPGLEEISIAAYLPSARGDEGASPSHRCLEWVIIGGESDQPALGDKPAHPARPFHVKWARAVLAQCGMAGVPAFMKQLGSHPVCDDDEDVAAWGPNVRFSPQAEGTMRIHPCDDKGGDAGEWPPAMRIRVHPEPRLSSVAAPVATC